MRGEGHEVAGGVLRRSGGESLLSHGCAVPAPPEGEPRALRANTEFPLTSKIIPPGKFREIPGGMIYFSLMTSQRSRSI